MEKLITEKFKKVLYKELLKGEKFEAESTRLRYEIANQCLGIIKRYLVNLCGEEFIEKLSQVRKQLNSGDDYCDGSVGFCFAHRIFPKTDEEILNWDDLKKYHIPSISKSDEYPKFTFCDGAQTIIISKNEDTGVDRSWFPDIQLLQNMLDKDFNIETCDLCRCGGRQYDIKFFTKDTREFENILELVNKLRYNYFLRTNYLIKLKDEEGRFLPKINTLEEIKSINLDWYDLAVDLLNDRTWEISGKTVEEVLAHVEYGIEI